MLYDIYICKNNTPHDEASRECKKRVQRNGGFTVRIGDVVNKARLLSSYTVKTDELTNSVHRQVPRGMKSVEDNTDG